MSANREVSTLSLAPSLLNALVKNGFRYVSDLEGMKPIELSQETGIDLNAAILVLKSVQNSSSASYSQNTDPNSSANSLEVDKKCNGMSMGNVVSARDLITKSLGERQHIITRCRALDTILGGGVPIGQLVSVA
jgi:hypothetical protein